MAVVAACRGLSRLGVVALSSLVVAVSRHRFGVWRGLWLMELAASARVPHKDKAPS